MIAVVKFGGTSVADEKARACAIERVKDYLAQGYSVAAVVSAMGRKGMPYATDTLLSLIAADAPGETRDLLMSCGETISACVFADSLCKAGVEAVPMNALTAGIKTDGTALSANITDIDTENINKVLAEGKVAVVTGFQGIGPDKRVNTLGRGGSDTSAVCLAAFLKADECIIYTDVPGAAACDPRIVPEAAFFKEINAGQMFALAESGAGVIHPRAVDAAIKGDVNLYIRSTFSRDAGTLISNSVEEKKGFVGLAVKHSGENELVSLLVSEDLKGSAEAIFGQFASGSAACADLGKTGVMLSAEASKEKYKDLVCGLYSALAQI